MDTFSLSLKELIREPKKKNIFGHRRPQALVASIDIRYNAKSVTSISQLMQEWGEWCSWQTSNTGTVMVHFSEPPLITGYKIMKRTNGRQPWLTTSCKQCWSVSEVNVPWLISLPSGDWVSTWETTTTWPRLTGQSTWATLTTGQHYKLQSYKLLEVFRLA